MMVCVGVIGQSLPPDMIRGVAITPDGPLTLADNVTLYSIDEALNIGADWIFVNSYLSQRNQTSSRVFKGPQAPLDGVLQSFVANARGKGLKVLLKPIVIPLDGSSWITIQPDNVTEWFDSYGEILCGYANLMEDMEGISIGLELMALTVPHNYTSYWLDLIARMRRCYNGILTYSSVFSLEWRRVVFWSELDWIGIDEYLPVASAKDPYPSVDQMTQTISNYFEQVKEYRISKNLTHIPVVLTEMGCTSYTNATFEPAVQPKNCSGEYYGNFTTQQDYFQASFRAIIQHSDLISGVFVYHFDNPSTSDYCRPCNLASGDRPTHDPVVIPDDDDSLFGSKYSCGLTFRGKPAIQVIKQAFGTI